DMEDDLARPRRIGHHEKGPVHDVEAVGEGLATALRALSRRDREGEVDVVAELDRPGAATCQAPGPLARGRDREGPAVRRRRLKVTDVVAPLVAAGVAVGEEAAVRRRNLRLHTGMGRSTELKGDVVALGGRPGPETQDREQREKEAGGALHDLPGRDQGPSPCGPANVAPPARAT